LLASSKTDPDAKTYAEFSQIGLIAHRAMLFDSGQPLLNGYAKMSAGYGRLARRMLAAYEKQEDLTSIPFLRSLGAIMVMVEMPAGDMIPLPGPSRANFHPSPAQHNWFFEAWDVEKMKIYPVRVSPKDSPHAITVEPRLLDNAAYPSKSGQGTIQALLETQKKANLTYARKDWPEPLTPAQEHVKKIFGVVQMTVRESHMEQTTVHNLSELDERMAQIELRYGNQEATPEELIELGWLNVESARMLKIDKPETDVTSYLDRAEDVFAAAHNEIPKQERSPQQYEVRLAALSLPMYRQLIEPADPSQSPDSEIEHAYFENLMELGKEIIDGVEACPPGPRRHELQDLLRITTACLGVTATTWGSYIVLPSSSVERTLGDLDQRASISIWPDTGEDERVLDYRSRVHIAETENRKSLDHNILTVPRTAFDHQLSKQEYSAMLDTMAFREGLDPASEAYISTLTSRLVASTDLLT
jgi:hypothetical protein